MSRIRIQHKNLSMEIETLGARIMSFHDSGNEVMRKASEGLQGYNGMVLAPFPNRIKDGQWSLAGQNYQLEINEPERNNALHGFAYKTDFEVLGQTTNQLTLSANLNEPNGYPFDVELEIKYELSDQGFGCFVSAVNNSSVAVPFGIAFHPYYPADEQTRVSIPAKTHILTDKQMIPIGTEANANQNFRFRDVDFDDCFSELERTNGIAEIKIDYEDRQIVLWQDQAFDFVMVFTTHDFESVSGQQTAMAIEAQSCVANAFNSEPALLSPEERFSGSWGLAVFGRG